MNQNPESHSQGRKGLAEKAISGAKWTYIGTAVKVVAQFLGQILLSRILGPTSVGQFAYAFLVVSLVTLILEMGLGSALVQRPVLDRRTIGIVTSRLTIVGTVGALVQWYFAELIAVKVFNQPSAIDVIQAMSGSYIVSALSVPLIAQLRREMAFREIQRSQTYSYLVSYLLIGVAAAALGAGVWSLVIAWYSNLVLQLILLVRALPQSISFAMPFQRIGVEVYGIFIVSTNIINWLIDSLPSFLVGRFWGTTSLGLYNTSSNLVRAPANHLVTALQQILFATVSRLQRDDRVSVLAYKIAVSVVLSVALPLFLYIALASNLIVSFLLGSKWEGAALLLQPLSLAMIPHALMAIAGPVLNGKGNPERELIAQSVSLLVILFLFSACVGYPVDVLAWGVFVGFLIRSLLMTYVVTRNLGLTFRSVCGVFFPPLMIGFVFFVASIISLGFMGEAGMAEVSILLLSFLFSMVACLVALTLVPRVFVTQEIAWLLKRIFGSHKSRVLNRISSRAWL
ncbi:oligosaccharide flippase family protein [Sphaerotilus mobilis]|uniref:O-antigen/teichoic acid export membrane protein n=1 Tax=Sphaerotilus mobilis TaxID=47994 RepID=A0A4Q7LWM7_9BURK|nr:oligosaccharide flippase family protein [Sphaerotilus mobilis]RZS58199.1 O-antigen/teichoic acid export membrane protein [Sphaerotilus mobilis]